MIRDEIRQVKRSGLDCYRYGFFARSGFQCQPDENQIFIDIKQVYP